MPRKTNRGGTQAPPVKRRKTPKLRGVAKAAKAAAARTKKAERAIRAGEKPPATTTAKEIALAERRLEALAYAKDGHGYADIGAWLDPPCTARQAKVLVDAALLELRSELGETAEQVRTMQLQRLDKMLIEPLKNAAKGDVQSGGLVLKIMERQAALVGADAPQRQELTGRDGKPVENTITIRRVIVPLGQPGGAGGT